MSKRRIALIVGLGLIGLVVVAWVGAFALAGVRSGAQTASTGVSSSGAASAPFAADGLRNAAVPQVSGGAKSVPGYDASTEGAATSVAAAERQIIRTATVTMTVKKVPASIDRLRTLIAASDGEISSLTYSAGNEGAVPLAENSASPVGGPQSATVVIRVPASKLESLARSVSSLGDVTAQTAGQDDITSQVIDLEARLKNLRAEEVRLRSFLNRATKVADMLSIENELSRVRGEIEVMEAQRRYMADQVAMATLTVSMSQPAAVVSPAGTNWGFADAVTRGVQAAAALLTGAVTVAIALLPVAAGILLVWWIVALVRRGRGRGPKQQPAETGME